uniref:Uncharacterized protein n=1 Tax=Anguilla anguilla TaxID=7936 RepID=A0A0E9QIR9_ANGAN
MQSQRLHLAASQHTGCSLVLLPRRLWLQSGKTCKNRMVACLLISDGTSSSRPFIDRGHPILTS